MRGARTRRLRRRCDDGGFTLAETLISAMLVTVVLGIAAAAFIAASRSVGRTDDEAQGLADVKTVVERLSRDALAARSVDPTTSDASNLTLWIDYDSDYTQTDDETVTWTIEPNPENASHFLVVRATAAGERRIDGRALVNAIAFSYDTGVASATTRTVSVAMQYDALEQRASARTVEFIARLRNVE